MYRALLAAPLALLVSLASAQAAEITGQYVEARTCDIWTGPCFANADFNLSGKQALMTWKITKGSLDGVNLEGLSVVAVVSAKNTLGLEQDGPARTVLIVDAKATEQQKDALVKFARRQGGMLLDNVVKVTSAAIKVNMCQCEGQSCAEVDATVAKVSTRCLDGDHDKACGNESAFYPPLSRNVNAHVAGVNEHVFRGTGLAETWGDYGRRGAYVGTFEVR